MDSEDEDYESFNIDDRTLGSYAVLEIPEEDIVLISNEENGESRRLVIRESEDTSMGVSLATPMRSSQIISRTSQVVFDEVLPAEHSYLGRDLEEISGRLIFSELSTVVIPLLPGTYGTLLPGQTLPLSVRDHDRSTVLRKCVESDHTFGIISSKFLSTGVINKAIFGTTAEIYEFSDYNGIVKIKARGRQRFRLLSSKMSPSGYGLGEVFILPEIKLTHPFTALQLTSLNSYRVSNKDRCRKIESNLLPWPKWVYDMYDSEKLVHRCDHLTFLKQGLRKDKVENVMPKDPTELSFWIASQLDSEKRLFILTLNSPIPRLRWLLNFLSKRNQFICRSCKTVIANQCDCFAMSVEGAQGTYVNPDGYHHDTITLMRVENVQPISPPSTHYSWFPGYAWSIVVCSHCQKHVGWNFVATNPILHPSKFWGLSRQTLETHVCTEDIIYNPDDIPIM